jgi:thymidylate synthase ThyX
MSDFPRRVYLLSPRLLKPEAIAVAFAKTSRSPEPFDRIAAELSDESSAAFHEKWVVGYGHSSVAEHAVLHIAMENVSRTAIECIESNRLASFTEKSTRFQKWSERAYVLPAEIAGGPLEQAYADACGLLLSAYSQALEKVGALARARFPREEGESESRWDARIRLHYVDVCRYLLPASVLANVGATINARALEHAIRKMLSHPLAEVRAIGDEVRKVALAEVPTLVKYAETNEYLRDLPAGIRRAYTRLDSDSAEHAVHPGVRLVHCEPEAGLRALAAAAVRFTGAGYTEALNRLRAAPEKERAALAAAMLGGRNRHDQPPRELEHVLYTFEAVMDQGAYFEVKRHRMMTQTPGPLTCELGYVTPRWIEEAGFRARYDAAMRSAAGAHRALRDSLGADIAAYVVPNGCLRRLVFTLNLREAFHFSELRSSPAAHPAVRAIAREVAARIREVHPLLAGYIRLEDEDRDSLMGESFLLPPL